MLVKKLLFSAVLDAVFGGFLTRLAVNASGRQKLSALNATETHAALKTTNNEQRNSSLDI